MTAFHSANMMLDYQDIGSGPHAGVAARLVRAETVFEPFIALAAGRYRVISIDWRGHGLSSKASGMSLAADDLLEDVRQLLTALRLDDVITCRWRTPAGWRWRWPKRCRSGYGAWCFSTGS